MSDEKEKKGVQKKKLLNTQCRSNINIAAKELVSSGKYRWRG